MAMRRAPSVVLHEARSSFRTGFFVARCFAPVADDETRIRVCTHSINREWCAMVSQDKPLWLVILSFYRVGCYAFRDLLFRSYSASHSRCARAHRRSERERALERIPQSGGRRPTRFDRNWSALGRMFAGQSRSQSETEDGLTDEQWNVTPPFISEPDVMRAGEHGRSVVARSARRAQRHAVGVEDRRNVGRLPHRCPPPERSLCFLQFACIVILFRRRCDAFRRKSASVRRLISAELAWAPASPDLEGVPAEMDATMRPFARRNLRCPLDRIPVR